MTFNMRWNYICIDRLRALLQVLAQTALIDCIIINSLMEWNMLAHIKRCALQLLAVARPSAYLIGHCAPAITQQSTLSAGVNDVASSDSLIFLFSLDFLLFDCLIIKSMIWRSLWFSDAIWAPIIAWECSHRIFCACAAKRQPNPHQLVSILF